MEKNVSPAPSSRHIGPVSNSPNAHRSVDSMTVMDSECINAWLAPSLSPRPKRMATTVIPPMVES